MKEDGVYTYSEILPVVVSVQQKYFYDYLEFKIKVILVLGRELHRSFDATLNFLMILHSSKGLGKAEEL
jgi:hypothetical protein